MLETLVDFYSVRTHALKNERSCLHLRNAQHCDGIEELERARPLFEARLTSNHKELVDSASRVKRIKRVMAEEMAEIKIAKSKAIGATAEAKADALQEGATQRMFDALDVDDIGIYLSWYTHHAATERMSRRLFGTLKLLPLTCRMHMRRVFNDKLSGKSDDSRWPLVSGSHIKPMAVVTPEVDHMVRTLLANDPCNILPQDEGSSSQLQLGDGDELLFLVNKSFGDKFGDQVKAMHAVAYDFTWVVAASNEDDESAQMAFKKLKDEVDLDPKRSKFVKPATWSAFCPFIPTPNADQELHIQNLKSIGEPHVTLEAECQMLESADCEYAKKRIHNLCEIHETRMWYQEARSVVEIQGGSIKDQFDGVALRFAAAQEAAPNNKKEWRGNNGGLQRRKLCAMYMLQFLRSREHRRMILSDLNYFRSIERQLTVDALGFSFPENDDEDEEEMEGLTSEERSYRFRAAAKKYALFTQNGATEGGEEGFPMYHHLYDNPGDYAFGADTPNDLHGTRRSFDTYSYDGQGNIEVRDSAGMAIIYDASMQELEETEKELLLMGTHFMNMAKKTGSLRSATGRMREVDASAVCADLYECEAKFLRTKRELVNHYLGAYELATDPTSKGRLAQTLVDIIAQRPRIDFQAPYFSGSYAAEITQLETYSEISKNFSEFQRVSETALVELNKKPPSEVDSKDPFAAPTNGRPSPLATWGPTIQGGVLPLLKGVGVYDFLHSMGSMADLHRTLLSTRGHYRRLLWELP